MQCASGLLLPDCPGRELQCIGWCFTVGFQRMLLKYLVSFLGLAIICVRAVACW